MLGFPNHISYTTPNSRRVSYGQFRSVPAMHFRFESIRRESMHRTAPHQQYPIA